MKTYSQRFLVRLAHLSASLTVFCCLNAAAVPPRVLLQAPEDKDTAAAPADESSVRKEAITIEKTATDDEQSAPKSTAWLGVSASEASETLASQLDLQAGTGLVVTFVATDSPAAKAGLRKNDVLVTFDDQSLVHPAQLRKLVRSHKPGDTVRLGLYRAAKLQSASVTLGQKRVQPGPFDEEQRSLENGLDELQKQLKDLHLDVVIRDQMKAVGGALGNVKIDQHQLQEDIRRNMEEIRSTLKNSMSNAEPALGSLRKLLEDIGSDIVINNNARVMVRNSQKGVKSLVNTDDSGTIVIVSNPKLHLTAHDKEGHLLFDGKIETADQRSKVPHDLWQRVEPLLDKLNANTPEEPEVKEAQ